MLANACKKMTEDIALPRPQPSIADCTRYLFWSTVNCVDKMQVCNGTTAVSTAHVIRYNKGTSKSSWKMFLLHYANHDYANLELSK